MCLRHVVVVVYLLAVLGERHRPVDQDTSEDLRKGHISYSERRSTEAQLGQFMNVFTI